VDMKKECGVCLRHRESMGEKLRKSSFPFWCRSFLSQMKRNTCVHFLVKQRHIWTNVSYKLFFHPLIYFTYTQTGVVFTRHASVQKYLGWWCTSNEMIPSRSQ